MQVIAFLTSYEMKLLQNCYKASLSYNEKNNTDNTFVNKRWNGVISIRMPANNAFIEIKGTGYENLYFQCYLRITPWHDNHSNLYDFL